MPAVTSVILLILAAPVYALTPLTPSKLTFSTRHPFSLTSGPEDEYLSVHIRTVGDWSYHLYTLFQEALLSGSRQFPRIHIDRPYGAASQDHIKYDTVLLIGLGIGLTPFISVLKNVIRKHHNRSSNTKSPSKVYLHWVTREHYSFAWFRDAMKELSNTVQYQSVIQMNSHLTSVYKEGDARSVIITSIQALHLAKRRTDVLSQTPVRTHFSLPNWPTIFSNVADRHEGAQIGVFYCGPSSLAKDLEKLCAKFSTQTTTRFMFHKENY